MKKRILLLTIMSLLYYGCEKKDIAPTPNELLQGKWKPILIGNGSHLKFADSTYITEYYNDSLFREYDSTNNQYNGKYIINDSFLIRYEFYLEDTFVIYQKYEFYDNNNKLKLEHQNLLTIFMTSVFERVE